MESWKRSKVVFFVLSLPGTFWLLAFFFVPLAYIFILSFSEKAGLIETNLTWTFSNYLRSLEPIYIGIFWQSAWIAGLTTFVCLVVAFPIAMAITFAPARWKPILLLAIILPFWTNLLIRTYALIAVLRENGYINDGLAALWSGAFWVFDAIGLDAAAIMGERFERLTLLYNHFAVIFGLVYVHLPFMVLPIYASLERLDRSYLEASLDLGAGQWRTFFSVTVPMTAPGIVSGVIITFIPALGSFLTPDLLGGPDSLMIGNLIERQFKAANDWPFGSAISLLLMYLTFFALALSALARVGTRSSSREDAG